jgi:hypothetical protein
MTAPGQADKTHCEHNASSYPSIADMRAEPGFVLPLADLSSAANCLNIEGFDLPSRVLCGGPR